MVSQAFGKEKECASKVIALTSTFHNILQDLAWTAPSHGRVTVGRTPACVSIPGLPANVISKAFFVSFLIDVFLTGRMTDTPTYIVVGESGHMIMHRIGLISGDCTRFSLAFLLNLG